MPELDRTTHRWVRLGLAVGGVLAMLVGAAVLTVAARTPTYAAEVAVAIDQVERLSAAEGPEIIDKLSRLRFKYAGLVRTRVIAGPVASELGRGEGEVAGAVYANVHHDSLLLTIGARHGNPDGALAIASSAAEHVVDLAATEQEEAGVAERDRFELTVVTPAEQARRVDHPGRRAGVVGIGLGLVLLLALIPLRFLRPR